MPLAPTEVADLLGTKEPDSAVAIPMWAGERLQGLLVLLWTSEPPRRPPTSSRPPSSGSGSPSPSPSPSPRPTASASPQLEDRDRIARDLHDLVIQRLFAVGLSVQGAARDAVKPVVAQFERVVDDLDDTIKDVRRTIYQLHASPPRVACAATSTRSSSTPRTSLGFAPSLRTEGPLSAVPDEVGADPLPCCASR